MGLILLVLLGPTVGDTPEETLCELKKRVAEEDWKAYYHAMAPSDRAMAAKPFEAVRKDSKGLARFAKMIGETEEAVAGMKPEEFILRMFEKYAAANKERFEQELGILRDAEFQSKIIDGDYCLLKYVSNGETHVIDLVREGGKWYYSDRITSQRGANERNATAGLREMSTAQVDFHSSDRDGDGIKNYWVKDVAGLYGIRSDGKAIQLISKESAQADLTAGRGEYESIKDAFPRTGYHFVALKQYVQKGKPRAYDDGTGRHAFRYGFAAIPAKYGRESTKTYIINQEIDIFWKDTDGKTPSAFPEDPSKEGWKVLD